MWPHHLLQCRRVPISLHHCQHSVSWLFDSNYCNGFRSRYLEMERPIRRLLHCCRQEIMVSWSAVAVGDMDKCSLKLDTWELSLISGSPPVLICNQLYLLNIPGLYLQALRFHCHTPYSVIISPWDYCSHLIGLPTGTLPHINLFQQPEWF